MFKPDPAYTARYCEENVRLLCNDPVLQTATEAYAMFISNPQRAVLMWGSRASQDQRVPVCWDYHVVLIARFSDWLIYDHDFRGPRPCQSEEWLAGSFPQLLLPMLMHDEPQAIEAPPLFKLIPAAHYRKHFSSSRAHMRKDGVWQSPPPDWPPFEPEADNLQRHIDMNNSADGAVRTFKQLLNMLYPTPNNLPSPF